MSEAIKVILKSKSIPVIVDFCIEEKIEFNVRPQAFPDTDWEINLLVKDIKTAVFTGMFLRENRIDIAGNEQQQQKVKKPPVKKKEDEKQIEEDIKSPETGEKGLF
ncbi:MAG TPA: hypothetical protein VHI78_13325 [Bacteroidales bacterium]|jgi:hypothetical protein|nr:hypothetical protein [Bacteroidales bacterium]